MNFFVTIVSIVQVSHRSAKRLHDSVLSANVEEIKRSIEESTAVVNFVLEVFGMCLA